MAMKVSLCGPHSLDTSTLRPTESDPLPPGEASGACVDRYWYLSHQVGLLGSRAASAGKARASTAAAIRTVIWASGGRTPTPAPAQRQIARTAAHADPLTRAALRPFNRDVLPPAALAARRCAPAAGRAAPRRTRGAPARLARAFRLTLAATGLVHRGCRDPLRRPAAAAAALRAALDLLVLPFALVAPGARHPSPPRLTGGAKAGKLGTAWRGATFGGAGPRSLRAAEASAGDGTERQGAQLDGRGEREQRRCASELLVRRTRQPVPGGIAGAEDQRREERLPGGAKPDRHEAPHRLDGARPPQSERQRMKELQEHERGGAVRARDEPPTQRGPRTGGAQQRRQVESPEQRRERPQSGDLGEHP